MQTQKAWGREEWIAFTRNVVAPSGMTKEQAEDWIVRIGEECHRAQQAGEPAAVMHAAAKLASKPCWCCLCRPDVR